MYFLCTLFDYNHTRPVPGKPPLTPRPILTIIYNSVTNQKKAIELFYPGRNITALEYKKRLKLLGSLFSSGKIVSCNDAKAHADNFDIGFDMSYKVYSRTEHHQYDPTKPILDQARACLAAAKRAAQAADPLPLWQNIMANASLIYAMLQRRGFWDGVKTNYPIYSFISSGRASASSYTIFNRSKEDVILPHNRLHTKFIHFDWIAADFRAGSILSQDTEMLDSFNKSDPYTVVAEGSKEGAEEGQQLTRAQCKQGLFEGVYNLNPSHAMVAYYERFRQWMEESIGSLKENGYLSSLLGRKFYLEGEPDAKQHRSVFNAVLQGTVAHALQSALWQIYHHFPYNFLTDLYDGVIMTSDESELESLIKHIGEIMFKPFQLVLKDGNNPYADITFPLAISVGTKWGEYERVKVIR